MSQQVKLTEAEQEVWERLCNPDTITPPGNRVGDLLRIKVKVHRDYWIVKRCPYCKHRHEHGKLEGPRLAHCHQGEYYLLAE